MTKRAVLLRNFKREWPLHLMLLAPVTLLVIYRYVPMLGIAIAFEQYQPGLGVLKSPWVWFDNFKVLFGMPGFLSVIRNTLVIAIGKIVLGIIVPVIFSIMLYEISNVHVKKVVQTVVYMPHFISWVLMAGIIIKMLSQNGIVNQMLMQLGIGEPVIFLTKSQWFPYIVIGTDLWKEFGYGSIIYLATISGISPSLYEAASIDGAGRFKQILHVTLPGLSSMIILMSALSLGRILDAGFDQVFNLYSPIVYNTGDIIDTYVYRMAFESSQFHISTAAGLFKSAISFMLLAASYRIAFRMTGYRLF